MPVKNNVVTIDLTNYRDNRGGRVPEGRWRVRVHSTENGISNKKNPMITVWLEIVGRWVNGRVVSPGAFEGVTIIDRMALTEKAMFKVVGFMQAVGLAVPHRKLRVDISTWVNKVLDIDVMDDMYEGTTKSKPTGYMIIEDMEQAYGAEDVDAEEDEDEEDPLDEFAPDEDVEDAEEDEEDEDEEIYGDNDGMAQDDRRRMREEAQKKSGGNGQSAKQDTAEGDVDLDEIEI